MSSSFAHRAGSVTGYVARRYLSLERTMKLWLIEKGTNPALCNWLFRIFKLGIAGLVLYVSFWVALVFLGIWILKGVGGLTVSDDPDAEVGFNSDELFPDPYSQDNIYDPVFNHDDS